MDIKIDAVFSLASDGPDDSTTRYGSSAPSGLVVKEEIKVKEEVIDPAYESAWFKPISEQDDSMVSNDVKPFSHGDTPPSLSMERDTGAFRSMVYDSGRECMPPPVLEPETAFNQHSKGKFDGTTIQRLSTKKKKSMQIFPSYIVLTRMDKYLKSRTKLSYRTFRREHRECPNICKKIHFRRKLKKGLDVFNVRAPSKHNGYNVYLDLNKTQGKQLRSKSSSKLDTRFDDLIQKYSKSINRGRAGRVMRSVQSLPKDFIKALKRNPKSPAVVKFITEARQHVITETEKEISFKRDLAKLKRLIAFQRSLNKTKKEHRQQKIEKTPIYFKSGTSVVSGRVRKSNTRYETDYARTKDEEVYYQSLSVINENLKRETKQILKATEDIYTSDDTVNAFEVALDIAEDSKHKTDVHKDKKKLKYWELPVEEKDRINARRRENKRKKLAAKAMKNVLDETKDGVIIKELPSEYDLLTNLLLSGDSSNTIHSDQTPSIKTEPMETEDEEKQYSFAKSIIKRSSDDGSKIETNSQPTVRIQCVDTVKHQPAFIDTQTPVSDTGESTMDADRAQLLRIPEKVRRLFVKKKTPKSPTPSNVTETAPLGYHAVMDGNVMVGAYPIMSTPDPPLTTPVFPSTSITFPLGKQTFVLTPAGIMRPISECQPQPNTSNTTLVTSPATMPNTTPVTMSITSPVITHAITPDTTLSLARRQLAQAVTKSQNDIGVSIPPPSLTVQDKVATREKGAPSQKQPGPVEIAPKLPAINKTPTITAQVPASQVQVVGTNQPVVLSNTGVKKGGGAVYYQFQMGGKNILVPVNQGQNQPKAFVMNQSPPPNTKTTPSSTNNVTTTGGVLASHQDKNFVVVTPAMSKILQNGTTVTISSSTSSNAHLKKGNELNCAPRPTLVYKPSVKSVITNSLSPVNSPGTQTNVSSNNKTVIHMYPRNQPTKTNTSTATGKEPLYGQSLLANGQRFTLIPTNTAHNDSSSKSSLPATFIQPNTPMRYTLVPAGMPKSPSSSNPIRIGDALRHPSTGKPVLVMPPSKKSSVTSQSLQTSNNSLQLTPGLLNTIVIPQRSSESVESPRSPMTVLNQLDRPVESRSSNIITRSENNDGTIKFSVLPTATYEEKQTTDKVISAPVAVETLDEEKERTQVQEKPIAFAEATTAREEKLKKLKALLKERQMAVEKLQKDRLNTESDGEK